MTRAATCQCGSRSRRGRHIMHDDVINLRRPSALEGLFGKPSGNATAPASVAADPEELSCPAYTYLRGAHERALQVEFRLLTGNSEFFPYSLLGPWRYNP